MDLNEEIKKLEEELEQHQMKLKTFDLKLSNVKSENDDIMRDFEGTAHSIRYLSKRIASIKMLLKEYYKS